MTAHSLVCDAVCLERTDAAGDDHLLLDQVSARFEGGRIALVRGPVGAGKSSLVHVLGGLLRPTAGTISADGEPISRWVAAHRDRWRRRVGIVLQSPHLLPGRSALANVALPLVPRGGSMAELERIGRQRLAELSLEAAAKRPARELSGGERQRVALARALVAEPDFVLTDEPTAHQDDSGAQLVVGTLARAAERGAVVLIATHDRRVAESDPPKDVYQLDRGRLERKQ